MSIKIGFCSDLHFEFYKHDSEWMPPLPLDADVLVLAGDISVKLGTIEAIQRISDSLPNTQIVAIAGNHDFYRSSIDRHLNRIKEAFDQNPRVHFLENKSVELGGITFLGCTLWSGFDALGKENTRHSMREAGRCIEDFRLIRDFGGEKPFTPMSAIARHRESRQWLANKLKGSNPDSTVVVTHFPPVLEASHGTIPQNILTSYFQANCSGLIDKYQPRLWIYGHNHWSDDFRVGKTQVVSNQLGYPQEEGSIPAYDPDKIVEIGL